MELIPLSENEVERRDAIDAAFVVDEAVPAVGNATEVALAVIVRNPHGNLGRIELDLGEDEIVEDHTVPREESVILGVVDLPAGEHELAVRWITPEAFSFVDVACRLSHAEQTLVIDAWDPLYPPRILLDDVWLNRPLGVSLTQTGSIDEIDMPEVDLLIMHDGFGHPDSAAIEKLVERSELTDANTVLGVDLDLWIDGKRPCPPNPLPLHHFGPVVHGEPLPPGRHHVRVADRHRHRILVDTDIVSNGADWVGVEIADPSGEDPFVDIRKGGESLYSASMGELSFVEGLTPQDDLLRKFEIDGHELPPGLESWLDRLNERRETAKRVRGNYKRFLELRKSAARKTKAGEPLTDEEREAASVKKPEDIHDWVKKRKKTEGLHLKTAGSTGADGTVTVHKKKTKKTPFDEFSEYSTEFIHEASHVRQLEKALKKAGVNVKKWKKCAELEKRYAEMKAAEKAGKKTADGEAVKLMLELIRCRTWKSEDPAIKRYIEAISRPEAIAKLEIDEYAGDLDWLDKVIRLLASQAFGIMAGYPLVPIGVGEEHETIIHQNPDGPPRVRVIRGKDTIEEPVLERIGPGPTKGWGRYRLKIKGRAKGTAKVEVICGDKRMVVRVSVR